MAFHYCNELLPLPLMSGALIDAVRAGKLALVQDILGLNRQEQYVTDENGSSAIHWAAQLGQEDIVQLLLVQMKKLTQLIWH